MGIREMVNSNQRGTTIGVATITVLAVATVIWQVWPTRPTIGTLNSFYSDDDGKSYFHDTLFKFPPFDHDGKTAYRAIVFKNADGEPFVGFLQRYNAKTQKLLSDAYSEVSTGKKTQGEVEAMISSDQVRSGTETKLPGADKKWRYGANLDIHELKSAGGATPIYVAP